jgi:hypothetical protein
MNSTLFYQIVGVWMGVALVVFPFALLITAPYGRHSKNLGWMLPNKLAWVIMESPSPILFAYFFLSGSAEKSFTHWVFFALYLMHYINRTYIWPFKIRSNGKKMPVLICCAAFFFNLMNGSINGYFLGSLSEYSNSWMFSWQFILGIFLFLVGFTLNIRSDNRLIGLRKLANDSSYKIPVGGMFEKISCPNIFGEIVEWIGWGVMTWSLATASFSVWTVANLLPRALDHHKWYKSYFENYPSNRKAVLPYLL